MSENNNIEVGGRLHSIATGNVLTGANEVFDDDKNKKQSDINTETYALVNEVNAKLDSLSPEQQSALSVATKANKNEANLGYYVCDTEANVAAKVVANATGYVLSPGGSIKIKMNNANTADNATLNINSTGVKPLYYDGERTSASNSWEVGEIVEVYYDGTNFYANNVEGSGKFATGEKIKNVGIDDEPTAQSDNLVKSRGVNHELVDIKLELKLKVQFNGKNVDAILYLFKAQEGRTINVKILNNNWLINNVENSQVIFGCGKVINGEYTAILPNVFKRNGIFPPDTQHFEVPSCDYIYTVIRADVGETVNLEFNYTDSLDERVSSLEGSNFHNLDLSNYDLITGNPLPNNKWGDNKTIFSKLIPITDLKFPIKITGTENSSVIVWLNSIPTPGQQMPFSSENTKRTVIENNVVLDYESITSDTQYLAFLSENISSNLNYEPLIQIFEDRIDALEREYLSLDERVSSLEEGEIDTTDIVALNHKTKILEILKNSKKDIILYPSGHRNNKTLNLIHFSDLHGDGTNLQRLLKFKDEYSEYIDDVLCTGDVIRNVFNDDFTFWTNLDGAENILISIGNHEYYNGETASDSDYLHQITQLQVYNKFILPNVNSWNVIQPTSAETLGFNYYYKDYPTQKIRIIVIDNFRIDLAQEHFVSDALATALTNSYHVIMASHYGSYHTFGIDCNFNSNYPWSNVWLPSGINEELNNILDFIDDFIANGGKFICWLCGHTHVDFFGKIQNHTNQVQINVSCASSGVGSNYTALIRYCDQDRTMQTKSQDLFNIFSIDTTMGYFRIYRIGASVDCNMRSRQMLVYDYLNNKLINER